MNLNQDDPGMNGENTQFEIRAHSLLCLQGYRSLGYSPEFIEKMDDVTCQLSENPDLVVRIICSPDIFCRICPNLVDDRCISGETEPAEFNADTPDNSTSMDYKVLEKLGFREDEIRSWAEILLAIGRNVTSADMDDLCGECRWREFDYCAKALDILSQSSGT